MIWCKLKKWQNISGLSHTSTSWKVCSDIAGTRILKQWDKSNMLDFFFWDVELPPDVIYYVFSKRHFSSNTSNAWSNPMPVMNQSVEYSNILYQDDTEIEAPSIFVNVDEILKEDASNFPFRVSKFRSNNDKHKYTSFLILDQNDNILYSRMLEEENKEGILVPSDYKFTIAKQLKFIAIQGGMSGLESPIGKKYIEIGVAHNFEILTALSNIPARQDLTVKFSKIDQSRDLGVIQVDLLDYSTDTVVEFLSLSTANEVKIPWYLLQENNKYRLRITIQDDMVDYRYVYRNLLVENYTNTILRAVGANMNQTLTQYTLNNLSIPDGFHSEALFNKKIIIPKKDIKECGIYSINSDNTISLENVKPLSLGYDNHEGLWVRPLNKDRFLVDGIKNGKACFLVYSYNTFTEEYALTKSIERDETQALGKTNNVIQIAPDEFIYIPVGSNVLKKVNINTGNINTLEEIPLENITRAVVVRTDNNRLYIVNGVSYEACMYNIVENTFALGYSYGPNHYINKDTKPIPLINGSTLIVKLTQENDEQDTSSLQYFDWVSSTLKDLKLGYKGVTIGSTLLLYSGAVLLTKSGENKTTIYQYT